MALQIVNPFLKIQNYGCRRPSKKKILHLRKTYHLGEVRISWFLGCYHGIKVSADVVCCVLKCTGMNRLPRNAKNGQNKVLVDHTKDLV